MSSLTVRFVARMLKRVANAQEETTPTPRVHTTNALNSLTPVEEVQINSTMISMDSPK